MNIYLTDDMTEDELREAAAEQREARKHDRLPTLDEVLAHTLRQLRRERAA